MLTAETMDAILRKRGLGPSALRTLTGLVLTCSINGLLGLDAVKHLRAAADAIEEETHNAQPMDDNYDWTEIKRC